MILRALLALAAAGLLLAACGPDEVSQKQICGDRGCDACIGAACSADGGIR